MRNPASAAVNAFDYPGFGVAGFTDTGAAIDGRVAKHAAAWAGFFDGDVQITGTLFKGADAFKIDHPLEPETKFLSHSVVESPDMKNIYDGVAVFDEAGEVIVTLPDWFEALNEDFRYQLTPMGAAFVPYVADEIAGNRLEIGGGIPGRKVSWQVTGIRHDAYANAHRIPGRGAEAGLPPRGLTCTQKHSDSRSKWVGPRGWRLHGHSQGSSPTTTPAAAGAEELKARLPEAHQQQARNTVAPSSTRTVRLP